jgi:hypothetical protein
MNILEASTDSLLAPFTTSEQLQQAQRKLKELDISLKDKIAFTLQRERVDKVLQKVNSLLEKHNKNNLKPLSSQVLENANTSGAVQHEDVAGIYNISITGSTFISTEKTVDIIFEYSFTACEHKKDASDSQGEVCLKWKKRNESREAFKTFLIVYLPSYEKRPYMFKELELKHLCTELGFNPEENAFHVGIIITSLLWTFCVSKQEKAEREYDLYYPEEASLFHFFQ